MVPWSHVCVQGKPLLELYRELPHRFPKLDHTKVLDDVKIGGYHVLAGKGSTEFGIASATTESTPAVIGKDGIEDVFELQLTNEELALFKASCAVIREHVAKAEAM